MVKVPSHEIFESIVGETIDLEYEDGHFRAKVQEVSLLPVHQERAQQPFSVILLADDAQNHGQRIYQVSHPKLGVVELFAVPIGPGAKGMRYEVVFN
jgi:hypothetical protein